MSDGNPFPYSAVVATPLVGYVPDSGPNVLGNTSPLESPDTELPFSRSDELATKIAALVSEEKTLDSRFKDICDIASANSKFEYQESALFLCQRFETLVWQSRNIAGIALVALNDFNEIVLDFLSKPDAAVRDRLKELTDASKSLQRERDSATNQKSSFEALIKGVEDFQRMLHSELGTQIPTRRRRTNGVRAPRTPEPPPVAPRSDPLNGLMTITASVGVIPWSWVDRALEFERIAERAVFPWYVSPPPEAQEANPAATNTSERTLYPPVENAELAALPRIVGRLIRDLSAFASRVDAFDTVFTELAREQDIFIVYLKDGQSVANQGYKSEINRMRRHLLRMCNVLDAYSKGKLP